MLSMRYVTMSVANGIKLFHFFFSSRRRHTRFDCDWSSDVCSSDLIEDHIGELEAVAQLGQREGVAARHHPVADVRLREARAQVHLRRATRVRRPARGKRGEQRDAHPEGVRTHGETLSVARIRALVESAARIALPTPLAPGIRDFARIESRWRSAADLAVLPPEHAAQRARTMASMRARIEASDVCRHKRCADIICRGAACCAPTHRVLLYTSRVISVATAHRRRPDSPPGRGCSM